LKNIWRFHIYQKRMEDEDLQYEQKQILGT